MPIVLLLALYFAGENSALAEKKSNLVHVYSARKSQLIDPVFKKFTEKTGIRVEYTTLDDLVLVDKLAQEKDKTIADVLIAVDAGTLWLASEKHDLLKPYKNKTTQNEIPSHLRDPKDRWFAMSVRARTIAYSTERVKPDDLSDYESLADPKWKSKTKKGLCLRSSKKVYNQSLVASQLISLGEERVKKMIQGWVANLAAPVFSSDDDVLKAIDAGQCDVGIVNSYYFGRLYKKSPSIKVALHWIPKSKGGTHVNISGGGITRYAKNNYNAEQLMKWLAGAEAQQLFANENMEFPANTKAKADTTINNWGKFDQSDVNLSLIGPKQAEAVKLMDQGDYK